MQKVCDSNFSTFIINLISIVNRSTNLYQRHTILIMSFFYLFNLLNTDIIYLHIMEWEHKINNIQL